MSGRQIGWKFPPTNGGRVDGFNDPGMAHFGGNPLASLAREIIQNSLDARDPTISDGVSVHVSFEIQEIERRDALGREELARAIEACITEVEETGDDDKAHSMLTEAKRLVRRQKLPYLRVSDRHTTGLRDRHWRALVKMQGASVKERTDAGGSHGIGKYAPFAVSLLRTVFYWTRFDEGHRRAVEKFQGKAVLMSHRVDSVETQGTGFYGLVDGCREIENEAIPERIRRVERAGRRGNGTSLWIAGFQTSDAWQRRIARSVIGNFFYAIDTGMLSVTIEPDKELEQRQLLEINKSTVPNWFEYLLPSEHGNDSDSEEEEAIWEAYRFWELLDAGDPTAEKEDNDLGHCRLWIRVSDELPSKVGFVRGTGMLITTQQRGLLRFPGLRDFIAVCVFDAKKGNELLRRMENPQHNQFEPDRLPADSEKRLGHAALKRVVKWIREEIKKHASPPRSAVATDLDELAKYLPDLEPEDPLDPAEATGDEVAFGGSPVVRLKPRRQAKVASTESEVDDGDGEDAGNVGGGGTGENTGDGGDGTGEGEGSARAGHGSRGGSAGGEGVPLSDVRFVPNVRGENRYRVSFTARGSGRVRIDFYEAGDSSPIERADVRAVSPGGGDVSLENLELTQGQRIEIEITGTEPIGGRSWRLRATRKDD